MRTQQDIMLRIQALESMSENADREGNTTLEASCIAKIEDLRWVLQ